MLGVPDAWDGFSSLLAQHFPGTHNDLPDDNPFPLLPPTLDFAVTITTPDPGTGNLPRALSVGASGSHYTPGGQVSVGFYTPTIDGSFVDGLQATADSQGNFEAGYNRKAAGTPWRCGQQIAVIATDAATGMNSDVATGQVDCE